MLLFTFCAATRDMMDKSLVQDQDSTEELSVSSGHDPGVIEVPQVRLRQNFPEEPHVLQNGDGGRGVARVPFFFCGEA